MVEGYPHNLIQLTELKSIPFRLFGDPTFWNKYDTLQIEHVSVISTVSVI